ncbi:MAG: T9SS type A sorting domain-containing protein [Salinivirgaceae bacterium]|nr:T9SS type A sorting domain-containing protein [Salinivirgaceae bacterium]
MKTLLLKSITKQKAKAIIGMFITSLFLSSISVAQNTTPGNNSVFTMSDLVEDFDFITSSEAGVYTISEDLLIAATDTLKIFETCSIFLAEEVLIEIEGVMLTNMENKQTFNSVANDPANTILCYKGFRITNSSDSKLLNASFLNGGGIKVIDSDMQIEACEFSNFDKSYTTGTIDMIRSNPLIRDCYFHQNAGPGVASGANSSSSPHIINNFFESNVTGNGNTPQINMGSSAEDQPIVIDSNIVIGEFTKAGGIAVSNFLGGSSSANITNNYVQNNRYGIALMGSNIVSIVSGNVIIGNNIENNPMQGGSGINFYGANTATVFNNYIEDNLWGITMQLGATPNFGDGTEASPGKNIFYNNGNNNITYALYNNTANAIQAKNNYWGTNDLDVIAGYIIDATDDATLGTVSYEPIWEMNIDDALNLATLHSYLEASPKQQVYDENLEANLNVVCEYPMFISPLVTQDYLVDGLILFNVNLPSGTVILLENDELSYSESITIGDEISAVWLSDFANIERVTLESKVGTIDDWNIKISNTQNTQLTATIDLITALSDDFNNIDSRKVLASDTIEIVPAVGNRKITFNVLLCNNPLENAKVVFENENYYTNNNGTVEISQIFEGEYDYTISYEGLADINSTVTVASEDVTEEVSINTLGELNASFVVVDIDLNPLENVTIEVNSESVQTNDQGIVSMSLDCGSYTYVASKTDYTTKTETFSINNVVDTIHVMLDKVSSINQGENSTLTFYPNPTKNHFSIDGLTSPSAKMTITNTLGKVIISNQEIANGELINIADLETGLYLVIINQAKQSLIYKIQKQ